MTDFSSNLKGNGRLDVRLSGKVHCEKENNRMGLEFWRTEQKSLLE